MTKKTEDLFNDDTTTGAEKGKISHFINLDVEMADGSKKKLGAITLWADDKNQMLKALVSAHTAGKVDLAKVKININSINSATPTELTDVAFAQ